MARFHTTYCGECKEWTLHSNRRGEMDCTRCQEFDPMEDRISFLRARLREQSFEYRSLLSPTDDAAFYGFGGAA